MLDAMSGRLFDEWQAFYHIEAEALDISFGNTQPQSTPPADPKMPMWKRQLNEITAINAMLGGMDKRVQTKTSP